MLLPCITFLISASGEAQIPRRKEVGTQKLKLETPTTAITEQALRVGRLELNDIPRDP